jgi:two-component system sensor histidine kinase KdpD
MTWSRLYNYRGGYPFAVLAVAAATALLMPFRVYLHPAQAMLLFVPVIVAIGRLAGVRASALGAVLAFLAVDFGFVPPYYVFTVASPVDWITLLVFLLVALSSGLQTGSIRQRERAAVQREREIALLSRLSSRLVSEESVEEMAAFIVGEVVAVLGADRAALYVSAPGDRATLVAQAGGTSCGVSEPAFADWVMRNDKAVALPLADVASIGPHPVSVAADEALPDAVADGVFLPLQTGELLEGVLYARPLSGAKVSAEGVRHLVAVANLAAAFLERRRLEDDAARAMALRESDRLKATLISSVSHELKTPLSAVTARVTGLLEEGESCSAARVHEELEAVAEDLGRLDSSIGDLVDVSRLESDAWRPQPETWDIGELLGTVAQRVPVAARNRVRFDVPEGLPSVRVDFRQIVRAVSTMVDNALSYAPGDDPVVVGARVLGNDLLVWVEDRGPGVPDDEKQRVFEKFYRGAASAAAPSGTGLGLTIAREIARAHGGRAWVEDAQPSGARFVISLPLQGDRP